jgi:hypothetical protein
MRRHAALIGVMAMVAALAGTGPSPVGAQAVTDQVFAGYGSGATISLSALQLGQTQAVNVQAAAAGQSTFSQGLPGAGLFNELGYIVQPAGTPGNAFGRGTGLELGLLTPDPNPDPNQILLSGHGQCPAQQRPHRARDRPHLAGRARLCQPAQGLGPGHVQPQLLPRRAAPVVRPG